MRTLACLVLMTVAAGCGTQQQTAANDRDTMTQRQKDSVLAKSALPGARGVGMAMSASDSAKARQARLDSIGQP